MLQPPQLLFLDSWADNAIINIFGLRNVLKSLWWKENHMFPSVLDSLCGIYFCQCIPFPSSVLWIWSLPALSIWLTSLVFCKRWEHSHVALLVHYGRLWSQSKHISCKYQFWTSLNNQHLLFKSLLPWSLFMSSRRQPCFFIMIKSKSLQLCLKTQTQPGQADLICYWCSLVIWNTTRRDSS